MGDGAPNDPANNLRALKEQGSRWPGARKKAAAAISRRVQGAMKQGEALKAPARFIGLLGRSCRTACGSRDGGETRPEVNEGRFRML